MQAIMLTIYKNRMLKLILLAGITQLGHTLLAHSWFWKLNYTAYNVQSYIPNYFSINGSEQTDIYYIYTVNMSVTISFLALLGLLAFLLKNRWLTNSKEGKTGE